MRWPDVILVNGPSSAGKTTLCRALQARILHPYICVGFDDFVFFSAQRYYRGADTGAQTQSDDFTAQGVQMVKTSPPGAPISVTAKFGPVFRRIIDGMAPAVRTLVNGGNAAIFDHVLHDREMYESCLRSFDGLNVFTVGVTCPIEIIEERERSRGDRVIGRARGLVEVVHSFCDYNAMVDTGKTDVNSCVETIFAALTTETSVSG